VTRVRLRGLTLFVSVVLLALVTRLGHAAGWASDAWITVKTKIVLVTTEELASSEISVDTVDGRVTLCGKVTGSAQKQKAEEVAKQVSGVREVRNLLQVVPPERAAVAKETDTKIQHDAEEALARDLRVAGSGIRVASVAAGVLVLGGSARSSVELLRALDAVRHVRGVRRVQSAVEIAAGDPEVDVWSGRELRQDGRGALDAASDLWLTADTRLRLLADPELRGLDISVDSRGQTVTLFGIVPSTAAKRAAEQDARHVSGVRAVHNELQVVPASKQQIVRARDNDLEREVTAAIYRRPELKHAAIGVAVRNGVARLSGTAPSQQHRLFAATAAHAVPGVRAVEEDIKVTTVTEASSASAAHPAPLEH
jgi:hyperosmotically inducible periplasmic protein